MSNLLSIEYIYQTVDKSVDNLWITFCDKLPYINISIRLLQLYGNYSYTVTTDMVNV